MIVHGRAESVRGASLLVGVREAATQLGIGRDACYQLVREGRLRHVSLGRRLLIPRGELEAFVARETEQYGGSPRRDP